MENRLVVLQRVLAQLEQDVDFISKYISIVHEDTLELPSLQPQSEDVVVEQETVEFVDTTSGDITAGLKATDTAFIEDDFVADATLEKFLARPVRIANVAWATTDSATKNHFNIRPWHLFMTDARIKRKLDNFAFFRGNLKLKIVVNASPFYSGFALVSYQPLPDFNPMPVSASASLARVPLSQRPHVWINAQANEAGELTVPFFWPRNWLELRSASQAQELGALRCDSFTLLRSANAAVTNAVTIQVYAWLEDVKLSGSTLSLSMQSGDEYGTGPISAPASALAGVAAALEPRFGRYATATRMIANTTAGVAKLFGFTNVPVLDEPKPVRVAQNPNFASPEIGYPVNKLTVDAKNELSIDPTIVGLPNKDELTIASIVTRPSYYYQTVWSTTDSVDKILAYQNVTPACVEDQVVGSQNHFVTTPMAFVGQMFDAWRGDIKYTFWVTSTRYHKGRLRITYDPQGDATNNPVTVADASSGAYTVILDLSETSSASITVPYQQALPYLRYKSSSSVTPPTPYSTSATPTWNMDPLYHNGAFTVRVATELSAPVDTSTVDVLVMVEGCENLEFANPAVLDNRLSPFQTQSSDIVLGSTVPDKREQRGLVNYGEVLRSLRPLMRRAAGVSPYTFLNPGGTGMRKYSWGHRKIPPYPGFDPNAIYSGTKQIGVGAAPATWSDFSYMQYAMLAFVAYRGSTFWYHTPHLGIATSTQVNPTVRVRRRPDGGTYFASLSIAARSGTSPSVNVLTELSEGGTAGTALMLIDREGSLPVAVPHYGRYLFHSTNPANATAPTTTDESELDFVEFKLDVGTTDSSTASATRATYVEAYCGAGTDFTCLFFLNTPLLYRSTTIIPTP